MSSIIQSITGGNPNYTPERPDLTTAATLPQVQTAYDQTQQGLNQQQQFLQALQGQNGIGNQSSVFNQLQGVADGSGANPAQAMLANSTGANVANQAALMAGQRGSNANAGLIARQSAQQGAGIQQNAAGQAAALQAQQSLGALNQMGGIAGQQVQNQGTAAQGYSQSAQQQQANLLNSIAQENSTKAGIANNNNNNQAAIARQAQESSGQLFGNLMGAAGTGIGFLYGGPAGAAAGGALGSSLGNAGGGGKLGPTPVNMAEGGVAPGPKSKTGQHFHAMAEGGKVPALVSPGEKYLDPKAVAQVKQGANPMSVGETIPGKPKVGGAKNDYANDTVPKTLDEGGIVIPRSKTQAKDPDKAARDFVAAVLAKKGR